MRECDLRYWGVLMLCGWDVLRVKVSSVVIFTSPIWVIVLDVDCGASFVYPMALI